MAMSARMEVSMGGQLEGKIAVVTGGTQGLGEAVCRAFALRGAAGVVLCGRDGARGERVAAALGELGTLASFVAADLADLDAARGVVALADRLHGRVDLLVNVAALTDRGTILSTDPALFDRMFAINVRAPFFLMQDAVRIMLRERIEGAIVNVLSMSQHGGQSMLTAYSASKSALGTVTKSAAFALLPHRIRVNGLNIGWMDTPGEDAIQKRAHDAPEGWLRDAEAGRPFGRLLKPAEVAGMIAFLCSAESGLMTGSLVDFDQTVHGCWDAPPMPVGRLDATL